MVVVYGTREVSTRVVVWFEPGMLNVLVLMSILVSVTTVVSGIVAACVSTTPLDDSTLDVELV
jgi:hypothetical protein